MLIPILFLAYFFCGGKEGGRGDGITLEKRRNMGEEKKKRRNLYSDAGAVLPLSPFFS